MRFGFARTPVARGAIGLRFGRLPVQGRLASWVRSPHFAVVAGTATETFISQHQLQAQSCVGKMAQVGGQNLTAETRIPLHSERIVLRRG